MSVISWIGTAAKNVGKFFAKVFKGVKEDGATLAITVLEAIKVSVKSGIVPDIAKIIDSLTNTHLATDGIALLQNITPRLLAVALGLQGLPDDPTVDDIKTFEADVYTALTGLAPDAKSKFYTTFAADLFGEIKKLAADGTDLTWFELADAVQNAYNAYLKDLAESETQTDADGGSTI